MQQAIVMALLGYAVSLICAGGPLSRGRVLCRPSAEDDLVDHRQRLDHVLDHVLRLGPGHAEQVEQGPNPADLFEPRFGRLHEPPATDTTGLEEPDHNVRRLLVAVSGVVFAVVLMFMERGFRNALFDDTVALVQNFSADIVLVSGSRLPLSTSSRFPVNTVWLVRGCPGVKSAYPIYIENFTSVLRATSIAAGPFAWWLSMCGTACS